MGPIRTPSESVDTIPRSPDLGHKGAEKTQEFLVRYYSWSGVKKDVQDYCRSCKRCARMKPTNILPARLLQPLEVPEGPWKSVSADFITGLPPSHGFDSVLVVVDRFSKEVTFAPTSKTISSKGTAELYRDYVWKHHGLLDSLVSDRGPQFASQLMVDLLKLLKIEKKMSTAYHPQTDGQTERVNHELSQYLHLFTAEKQDKWVEWLAFAQFNFNNTRSSATGFTPFQLTKTFTPRLGFEPLCVKAPAAKELADDMKANIEYAKSENDAMWRASRWRQRVSKGMQVLVYLPMGSFCGFMGYRALTISNSSIRGEVSKAQFTAEANGSTPRYVDGRLLTN
jgi:transposase InsO family protein